jgi:hypothetical protein
VVNTLKTIEAKVGQLVAAFGEPRGEVAPPIVPAETVLMNGPQHPTVAMDQSDIDKLLASFE